MIKKIIDNLVWSTSTAIGWRAGDDLYRLAKKNIKKKYREVLESKETKLEKELKELRDE